MGRRITLYLFGFFIGTIVCYFTVCKGKGGYLQGWWPQDRVLGVLQKYPNDYAPKAKCLRECWKLSEKDIHDALAKAEVVLPPGDHGNCHTYLVHVPMKQGMLDATYEICSDTIVSVTGLSPTWKNDTICNCK